MKLIIVTETDRIPHAPPSVFITQDHFTLASVNRAFRRQGLDKIYTVYEVNGSEIDVASTPETLARRLRAVEDECGRVGKSPEKQAKQNRKRKKK
jgi:galactose-1-phosphate uridylyltransferase